MKNNEEAIRKIVEDFVAELVVLLRGSLASEGSTPVTGDERLTKRVLAELVSHEGIVLEAYKDSKGIWTWGIGVTDNSGHKVSRYKDNPQTLQRVFEVFEWLVRTKYLPPVLKAFNQPLSEAQLAAALSFHYNTGAIGRASWVKSFNNGDLRKAREQFMNWKNPPEIVGRRTAERDLFFDGVWSNKGTATLFQKVNKPSYTPNWKSAKKVNTGEALDGVFNR